MKTNAMRILDTAHIFYETITYTVDEDHIDAVSVAHSLSMDPLQVCKTIVTTSNEGHIFVFCIPAPYEIALKKAKQITGTKSLELVAQHRLRTLTGYIRGGVSPIGMIHTYPTYIEETVQLLSHITVSGGQRGIQLLLTPTDLLQVTNAQWADLI